MEEHRIKHLEFIQAIINRLAGNSFLLKGWIVSLVAALFVLSDKDTRSWYAIIALLPTLCFWGLDAYYLRQERLFKKLFAAVAVSPTVVPFSMDRSPYEGQVQTWRRTMFSRTILFFYLPILLAILVVVGVSNAGFQSSRVETGAHAQ